MDRAKIESIISDRAHQRPSQVLPPRGRFLFPAFTGSGLLSQSVKFYGESFRTGLKLNALGRII